MPNIKSAKKRVVVSEKKNLINRAILSEVKTAIKKFNAAVDTNRIDEAEKLLPETMAVIDAAAAKGAIHKNNAANKKAAISKKLSDVKSGKVSIEIKKDNKTIAAEKAIATRQAREALRVENAQKAAERAAAKEAAKEAAKKVTKEPKKKEKKEAATEAPKEAAKKAPAKTAEAKTAEPKKAAAKKAPAEKKEAAEPKKPATKKTVKKEDKPE